MHAMAAGLAVMGPIVITELLLGSSTVSTTGAIACKPKIASGHQQRYRCHGSRFGSQMQAIILHIIIIGASAAAPPCSDALLCSSIVYTTCTIACTPPTASE